MTAEAAQGVVYLITAIAAGVWFAALQFLIRSIPRRPRGTGDWPLGGTGVSPVLVGATDAMRGSLEERRLAKSAYAVPEGLVVGHAEIPGTPADLSAKAAAILAKEQLKIVQRTDDRVAFEGAGPAVMSTVGQFVRRGELRLTAMGGDRTGVDYAIAVPGQRWLLTLGWVFQAIGIVALVAGFFLTTFLVVPSPIPEIRWQSVQMVQVLHFIWPPFLLGGMYRLRRRTVRARFEVLVHNLPYSNA
jgi:hypothetical protein